MICSKEEALIRLFYNSSSFFTLLILFLFSSSTLLLKILNFICRDQQYEYVSSEYDYEEEQEEEIYCFEDSIEKEYIGYEKDHFEDCQRNYSFCFEEKEQEFVTPQDSLIEETTCFVDHKSPLVSDFETETNETEQEQEQEDADSVHDSALDSVLDSVPIEKRTTSPITLNLYKSDDLVDSAKNYDEEQVIKNKKVNESRITRDERNLEAKKMLFEEKDEEEIYGDSCTVGSTSKSSSDWRSSIIGRDSGTDDPFSSSSRRNCSKWESYTVFQKYDEEMSFLERISAQKLHETESLRSIKVSPRSISGRIMYKFSSKNKKQDDKSQNPYCELESAYVAQICLTWEALNWNYKNFQSKYASNVDVGCSARIAQQFQQFQVLLQRYVENEPYEYGRRPEIYARMRHLAPKLLLVPEYRDSEDDEKENIGFNTKISSTSFLVIMEDGIKTFMNFLKADKKKPFQILASYFKQRGFFVDPTLIRLLNKVNQKKKMKIKDLRRSHKCFRKRKLKDEEEMEILMALIDLKIVSRVLRMSNMNENQLHWCEEKIGKVKIIDRKLQRDSTPLFFPSH